MVSDSVRLGPTNYEDSTPEWASDTFAYRSPNKNQFLRFENHKNMHSPQSLWNSQRSSHCWAFQLHACRVPVWPSVCHGNAFAWGSAVNCMGHGSKGFPMLSVRWIMRWRVSMAKSLLLQSRKSSRLSPQSIPGLLDWTKKTSSSYQCEIFVSTWRTWRRDKKSPRPRLVFESPPDWKKCDQT